MNTNMSLLIKPASGMCNLRCPYCFYLDRTRMFGPGSLRMDDAVLETMIRKFLALRLPVSAFGWQGGEPSLMGVDFFRRAVALQQKHGRSGQAVSNGLQTNGTLLDDEWGRFLHEYRFLVGVSVDGPAAVHDRNRVHTDGSGSHADVMRGLDVLRRHHVEFNVLTLVTPANQDMPVEIYQYLKSLGVNYHQYIECVEFADDGGLRACSVEPVKWGRFLCAIFDEWYAHDVGRVSVRLFDTILARMVDNAAVSCVAAEDCRQYLLVEHNGDLFPCDFHVRPDWKLGNIMTDELPAVWNLERFRAFGRRKREWNVDCAACEYLVFCAGCCPKNRPGPDPSNLSALCAGWRQFYGHTLTRFRELAGQIVADRRQAAARRLQLGPDVGRNAPCPCGSGRKYKKCCG